MKTVQLSLGTTVQYIAISCHKVYECEVFD